MFYQHAKGKGGTEQSTHYDTINAGAVTVDAPKLTAQIGSKESAEQLAKMPGMAWIGQLEQDPNVKINWQAVQEASSHWDYKAQGLTGVGAAVVVIIVTYLSSGTASSIAQSVAGYTGSTVAGGVASAAFTTLASEAAVSLANNQGDLGATLKDLGSSANVKGLVSAILTGGVLARIGLPANGQPGVQGGAQTFTAQLEQNLQAGAAKAMINTAVYGGSLEHNIQTGLYDAFVNTAAAQGANAIGDMTVSGTLNDFTNKVAHAVAGCGRRGHGTKRQRLYGGCDRRSGWRAGC